MGEKVAVAVVHRHDGTVPGAGGDLGGACFGVDPHGDGCVSEAMHGEAVESGGGDRGLFKTTDGGTTWKKLSKGLPEKMGKVAVDVSPANSNVVYVPFYAQ